jgi:hypothetical protein
MLRKMILNAALVCLSATAIDALALTFAQDGTSMHVYENNRRILTWNDYKDHEARRNYFVISDTLGETSAYDLNGTRIANWKDSIDRTPWILEENYFILIDTLGAAWAYDLSGKVLSKWNDYKEGYATANYYVLVDTLGATWVYRTDGTVIAKWSDSLDGQYLYDYFALSDTLGATWVYKLDGTIITKWNDTKSYLLMGRFYAMLDTLGELAIYDLDGILIQRTLGVDELRYDRYNQISYLKDGRWLRFGM